MTEKRFKISSDNNQNIYDKEEKCYYSSIDAKKLCDLLNDLEQEAKDNEHYHSEVLRLYKAVSGENEQLKYEIEKLSDAYTNLCEENNELKSDFIVNGEGYTLHDGFGDDCYIAFGDKKWGMFDKLEQEQVLMVVHELNWLYRENISLKDENQILAIKLQGVMDMVEKVGDYVHDIKLLNDG